METVPFDVRHARYLDVLKRLKDPLGDWRKGELEIVTNADAVRSHEAALAERFGAKGQPTSLAVTGVLHEDQYAYLLRDPVLFPPGAGATEPVRGTYIRLVYKNRVNGNPGIFILTATNAGLLVLNRTYRHATRAWMAEGQGTIARSGETEEQTVRRCLRDEVGIGSAALTRLCADFVSERGLVGDRVPMYLARVEAAGQATDPNVSGHLCVPSDRYGQALANDGTLAHEGREHAIRDGYTMSAFLLARLRGLL